MTRFAFLLATLMATPSIHAVDIFDRHTSQVLEAAVQGQEAVEKISSGDAARLQTLGFGITNPCIVVKTNGGNYAKALVSWAFRKEENGVTPVLILERFVTYNRERGDQTLAAKKNVMLFTGFGFNFDLGQVVPADQQPDIQFSEKRTIVAVGKAKLFGLNGSALSEEVENAEYDPTAHEGVEPRDFNGVWKVNADGRWVGSWELEIGEGGRATGRYFSDDTRAAYPLKGRIAGFPHRLLLEVELANAVQEFEVYLWTTDKSTMAGITTMIDRKFGVYAKRQAEAGEKEE